MPKKPKFPLPEYPIICSNGKLRICTMTGDAVFNECETDYEGPLYYDPDATAPKWMDMLEQIFAMNANTWNMIRHLHEVIGWMIWKTTVRRFQWIWTGHASSGKLELMRCIKPILQNDDTNNISIYGRFPSKSYKFREDLTLFVPFSRVFTDQEILSSTFLWERIAIHELPGILNLAIAGASSAIRRGGFNQPRECIEIKKEWINSRSQIDHFLNECCVLRSVEDGGEVARDIYKSYLRWRAPSSEKMGRNKFYNEISNRGHYKKRSAQNAIILQGVWVKAEFLV